MHTDDEQSMTLLCRQKKEEFSCVCVCASLLSTDEEREEEKKERKDRQVKKESQEAEQKDEKAH